MIRHLGVAAFFIIAVLGIVTPRAGYAQSSSDEIYYLCKTWTSPPWDNSTGTRRRLFPIVLEGGSYRGYYITSGQKQWGVFLVPHDFWLSLISEPNKNEYTYQFITRADSIVEFLADGTFQRRQVRNGVLQGPLEPAPPYYINCIKGTHGLEDEGAKSLKDVMNRTPNTNVARIADNFLRGKISTIPIEDPKGKATEKGSTALPAKEEPTANQVCNADQFQPLPEPVGTTFRSPQMVGLRNTQLESKGFDYISASGDALPLDVNVDIAGSKGKLVPYEAILGARDDWVSLPGVDESRVKTKSKTASKLLQLVIVGGAPEIAMSGLDLVEAELKRQSKSRLQVDAEWYVVDAFGSVQKGERYDSLVELVKTARERAAARNPDLLNEMQLITFLDGFERILRERQQPVQKVFWIKGSYPIPSSIPQRFEKLITRISDDATVTKTLKLPAKWLFLVSARTTGFSINYLKEPIIAQNAGDVIEEPRDALQPRRLIDDVALLATRLAVASVPMSPGEASRIVNLVLRGTDIFSSRGYVLPPELISALRDRLYSIQKHWSAWELRQEDLQFWVSNTKKSTPTIIDILQNADEQIFRNVPNLPNWARKPIRDLNADELWRARSLFDVYINAANKLVEDISSLSRKTDNPSCSLFYVPMESLGFGK